MVGALRAFGGSGENPALLTSLTQLGQVPFNPPNVGGWPQNSYWLTTATELARLNFASGVGAAAVRAHLAGVGDPDALAHRLSIDGWSDHTRQVLDAAATPQQVVTLALTSPEYVLN
jgi:uncharacterized protein (DUF1800 family)